MRKDIVQVFLKYSQVRGRVNWAIKEKQYNFNRVFRRTRRGTKSRYCCFAVQKRQW